MVKEAAKLATQLVQRLVTFMARNVEVDEGSRARNALQKGLLSVGESRYGALSAMN